MERLKEAVAECLKATELEPRNAQAYHELGIVHNASGNLKEAVTAWEFAVRNDPQYALAYYDLGLGYYEQDQMEKAIEAYQSAIAASEGKSALGSGISLAAVYTNLGVAHLALSQDSQAEKAFRKAYALDPKAEAGHIAREYLGQMFRGKIESSSAKAEPGKQRKDLHAFHSSLARQYYEQQKYSEAVQEFRKALRYKPQDPNGHISLGGILILQGKLQEAEEEFEEGLKFLPQGAPLAAYCYSRLGDIAWLQKQSDLAAEKYSKAAELNPQDANAHIGLGRYYESRALWKEAVESYRKGLEVEPANPIAKAGLKRAEEKGEEIPDLLAEMVERGILGSARTEFAREEKELLQKMRQAEKTGAVDYLKSRGALLKVFVMEKKERSGRIRLLLTAQGFEKYKFFRSQDALRAFEFNGVEAKYVFFLRDRRGEPVYNASGQLTPEGEAVYRALLSGQKKWILPSEPIPQEPGVPSKNKGDSPEVTALRLAGYEEVESPELQWLIQQTGCPQVVLEREFTLRTVQETATDRTRFFVHGKDMLMAFIARYRAGETQIQGLGGTGFFGSGSGRLCQ
ncbi:MAG: tetratricopeptide repeat protein [Elusimicrobia bacterium]|nr:tetratricopeptide repeat protein [Elusimicrobiota bacterium]